MIKNTIKLFSLLFLTSFFLFSNAKAESNDMLQAAYQQLQVTQQKNKLADKQLDGLKKTIKKQLENASHEVITQKNLERAELEVTVAAANLDATNLYQKEAQQASDSIFTKINNLENQLQNITLAAGKTSAVKEQLEKLQADLNYQKALLKWQQKQTEELNFSQKIAKENYELLVNYQMQLNAIYGAQLKQRKQIALNEQESILQKEQKNWLNQLTDLNTQLQTLNNKPEAAEDKRSQLDISILRAQEKSNLTHFRLVLLHLKAQLDAISQKNKTLTVNDLNENISQTNSMLLELGHIKEIIDRKIEILTVRGGIEKARKSKGMITEQEYMVRNVLIKDLIDNYHEASKQVTSLIRKTESFQTESQQALTKALARKQGLPGLSITAWGTFFHKFVTMPVLALQAANALKDQVVLAYTKLSFSSMFLIILVEFLWLWIWFSARDVLVKATEGLSDKRKNVTKNTIYISLQLFQKNLMAIFIIAGVAILFWLTGLSYKSFAPVIDIALVWFVFKIAIDLAKLTLLENVGNVSGKDVRLYRDLKWALIAGGLLTMLTVLAHQLPVGYEVTDFFNRLFMLFMLITSALLLRGSQVVPALLQPYFDETRAYLMRVVRLLSFLIPLTILSTGLIGFLGYVDLAWAIFRFEGIFLLVMSVYILLRGFLKESMEVTSDYCISHLKNGWLWTQAILRPLDKIFRIILFLFAAFILFAAYGWHRESLVVTKLIEFLHFHLVDVKGLVITPMSIIELIVAGGIVYWLSRWTREFAYRWFFAKTRDVGLRNSLSVLSQYVMFLVSIFLALKIIGIDLSGISYVLAGFAAGVGLGLRDLIKNYASGLLLLFERPVRTGDLVSIGNYEGEVMHLGVRAITVKTWDHMEVLVPNSETFEKPFTNWTHVDSIVRTVIDIKVSREDNPFHVQEVILKVLHNMPSVVSDPEPQVLFTEMLETVCEFEVKYYINLQVSSSRATVRSEVLFAIYSAFRQYGIRSPYPQHEVMLKQ